MKKIIPIILASLLAFTGCSFDRQVNVTEATEYEHQWAEGEIYYETSSMGLPANTEGLESMIPSGWFIILHDGMFYPLYSNPSSKAEPLSLGSASSKRNLVYYTSEDITQIPTLFEGDRLFFYSDSGVFDYVTVERYIPWGWSVGIRNMKKNTTGHVYVHLPEKDDDDEVNPFFSPEFADIYSHVGEGGGNVLIDKIGGTQFTSDFIKDGLVYGLKEGAPYDFEMYKGTNYFYYHASANIFFFQGFESYALWDYIPLQDYLYEITIPDYLLPGYYNIGGMGMFRLVRGSSYNENTDFSERLLYSSYPPGDYTEEELLELEENSEMPRMYSDNPILNYFEAYDETCFGYVDRESEEDEDAESTGVNPNSSAFKDELEAALIEASTTVTPIWLPEGASSCVIAVITTEKTGKVILQTADGKKRDIPYDRITGSYRLETVGTGQRADIIVQGLYDDYTIKLSGCEGYKNQDEQVTVEEAEQAAPPAEVPEENEEVEGPEDTSASEEPQT